MKKMLAFVLSTVLLIGLLAACGGEAPHGTDGSAASATTVPKSTAPTSSAVRLCNSVKQAMEDQAYPKCYGGCYLDIESFSVVILATNIDQAKGILGPTLNDWDTDDYRFEKTTISYQKLLEVQQKLEDNMDILNAMGVPIDSVSIDDMNQCVSVGVIDLNGGSTKAITELVPDSLLKLYNVPSASLDE